MGRGKAWRDAEKPARVFFVNKSDCIVRVVWNSFDGKEIEYAVLHPNTFYGQGTVLPNMHSPCFHSAETN